VVRFHSPAPVFITIFIIFVGALSFIDPSNSFKSGPQLASTVSTTACEETASMNGKPKRILHCNGSCNGFGFIVAAASFCPIGRPFSLPFRDVGLNAVGRHLSGPHPFKNVGQVRQIVIEAALGLALIHVIVATDAVGEIFKPTSSVDSPV
jgi:hypothetical protein